ncbi:hypothetical protein IQ277_21000 [Nostocales cyanobacterium LEGE 12452]|nr:hypothetical protein [Nostocales cyanobacterium LEGE 12452]
MEVGSQELEVRSCDACGGRSDRALAASEFALMTVAVFVAPKLRSPMSRR